jgi:hypothetical protein
MAVRRVQGMHPPPKQRTFVRSDPTSGSVRIRLKHGGRGFGHGLRASKPPFIPTRPWDGCATLAHQKSRSGPVGSTPSQHSISCEPSLSRGPRRSRARWCGEPLLRSRTWRRGGPFRLRQGPRWMARAPSTAAGATTARAACGGRKRSNFSALLRSWRPSRRPSTSSRHRPGRGKSRCRGSRLGIPKRRVARFARCAQRSLKL